MLAAKTSVDRAVLDSEKELISRNDQSLVCLPKFCSNHTTTRTIATNASSPAEPPTMITNFDIRKDCEFGDKQNNSSSQAEDITVSCTADESMLARIRQ